jgi:hypothetical protein
LLQRVSLACKSTLPRTASLPSKFAEDSICAKEFNFAKDGDLAQQGNLATNANLPRLVFTKDSKVDEEGNFAAKGHVIVQSALATPCFWTMPGLGRGSPGMVNTLDPKETCRNRPLDTEGSEHGITIVYTLGPAESHGCKLTLTKTRGSWQHGPLVFIQSALAMPHFWTTTGMGRGSQNIGKHA